MRRVREKRRAFQMKIQESKGKEIYTRVKNNPATGSSSVNLNSWTTISEVLELSWQNKLN